MLVRHLWQLKTVVFQHWCLIRTVPLGLLLPCPQDQTGKGYQRQTLSSLLGIVVSDEGIKFYKIDTWPLPILRSMSKLARLQFGVTSFARKSFGRHIFGRHIFHRHIFGRLSQFKETSVPTNWVSPKHYVDQFFGQIFGGKIMCRPK